MEWRLFLDENTSPRVALALSRAGYYATSVRDRGLCGEDDWDHLRLCYNEDLIICTKDADDFRTEHDRWQQRGDVHCGILLIGDWNAEETYYAILQFVEENDPNDVLNRVVAIPPAAPDFISTAARRLPSLASMSS